MINTYPCQPIEGEGILFRTSMRLVFRRSERFETERVPAERNRSRDSLTYQV